MTHVGRYPLMEFDLLLSDNTVNDVSISKHGLAPKAPNSATQYLDGTGNWSTPPAGSNPDDESEIVAAQVYSRHLQGLLQESGLWLSDNAFNNVSISRHGFTPKAPNDATKYLDGTGAYSVPAGTGGGVTYPVFAEFFVDTATVTVGNGFTKTVDTGQIYAWWQYQNAPANGDTWTQPFFLASGTYTIYLFGLTASSRGIQDVYIDNVKVGTIDWYGSLVYNVTKTIAGVSVATNGQHTFKSVINGKNASSNNYQLLLTKIWIQ